MSVSEYPFEMWRQKRGRRDAIVELTVTYSPGRNYRSLRRRSSRYGRRPRHCAARRTAVRLRCSLLRRQPRLGLAAGASHNLDRAPKAEEGALVSLIVGAPAPTTLAARPPSIRADRRDFGGSGSSP